MAKGYRKDAVDFDSLFDPDVMGDGPAAANLRSGGTPLKYANISYGSKGPDVGFRVGGVDVSNLWAAIGTATYVNRGGVPDNVRHDAVVPPTGGSANAQLTYSRNGTVGWTDGGGTDSGTWAPGGGTVGDAYDIAYTDLGGGSGTGVLTGATGSWQQVNADRSVSFFLAYGGGASITDFRNLNCQIRRRSDGAVLVNYNFIITASVTSDG